ncbi:MAG: type VI secretion system tube protein Hcp [Azoarcus sp.]|jgi:type VI secretion system secreted protein Hcp|nr:type VI secretion system tube protein Hcp [Azoarcus sp.]
MSHEIFVKIEGITGESKQAAHKGWVDVLDFSYSVTQSASMHTGGGGGVGKADFGPVSFSHYLDVASPNLFKYCASGKHIPTVIFSICKVGGGSQEFARVVLTDVIVANVSPGGASGGGMTETVALSYSKIETKVREQNTDGSMGREVEGNWDVKQNVAC